MVRWTTMASRTVMRSYIILTLIAMHSCQKTLHQKIYQEIQSEHYCFRRFNATHQIGCSSASDHSRGVIHIVDNVDSDINWILNTGTSSPYVPVVHVADLTKNMVMRFGRSGRVAGLLVDAVGKRSIDSFSPDMTCPNNGFDLYSAKNDSRRGQCASQSWNNGGLVTDLMFEDIGFPIFLITNETSINNIRDCYETFNKPENGTAKSWPLCAVELNAQMNGARNTPTCMSRNEMQVLSIDPVHFCDPLSSYNVFSKFFSNFTSNPSDRSVIVIASRIDSFSMFEDRSPGADSAITSLVTLLSIAKTLSQQRENMEGKRENMDILFALFDGESFDYIGSSRTVYDMMEDRLLGFTRNGIKMTAKLKLSHISHFIELNQLAPHSEDSKVWLHTDPLSTQNNDTKTKVNNLTSIIQSSAEGLKLSIQVANNDKGLPPASLQSFLKHDESIAGVVVTNHENQYTNPFYNSFLDDIDNISKFNLTNQLSKISTAVSRAVYKLVTREDNNTIEADENLVEELVDCFLKNASCLLFQKASNPADVSNTRTQFSNLTFPTYISVRGSILHKWYSLRIEQLLGYFTGIQMNSTINTEEACKKLKDKDYDFDWMAAGENFTGVCIRSGRYVSEAKSPAFIMDPPQYDSTKYSTWTESVWSQPSARIYLVSSSSQQWVTFLSGLVIFLISFVIVFLLDGQSKMFGVESNGGDSLPVC